MRCGGFIKVRVAFGWTASVARDGLRGKTPLFCQLSYLQSMTKRLLAAILSVSMLTSSCGDNKQVDLPAGSFGYDLAFLQRHDSVIVLRSGDARVAVSPKYQGKVFTSSADGDAGTSFGWIHYKAFEGPADPHMNAYGGENRLWLGPEGGKFSLFFAPGAKMEFANWKTPAAFDTEAWKVS